MREGEVSGYSEEESWRGTRVTEVSGEGREEEEGRKFAMFEEGYRELNRSKTLKASDS